MLSKFVTLAVVVCSSTVWAQGGSSTSSKFPSFQDDSSAIGEGSTILGQPKAKRTIVTLTPGFSTSEIGGKSHASTNSPEEHFRQTGESKMMEFQMDQGISDTLAWGASIDYGSGLYSSKETNTKNEGLGDPAIMLRTYRPQNTVAFHAGLQLNPSFSNSSCERVSGSKTTTCDRKSGGHSGILTAGIETLGNNIFGVVGSAMLRDRRKDTSNYYGRSSEYETTGGNIYGGRVFYERASGKNIYGLFIGYSHTAPNQQSGQGYQWTSSYSDNIAAEIHARLNLAPKFDLMPSAGYMRGLNKEIATSGGGGEYLYDNSYVFRIGALIGI